MKPQFNKGVSDFARTNSSGQTFGLGRHASNYSIYSKPIESAPPK